jgi:polyhydroxybutyrate depolymerase
MSRIKLAVFALLLMGLLMSCATVGGPYSPPIKGVFHEQRLEKFSGQYSVFIPDSFQPCNPGVMILTPNSTTAKAFVESDEGKKWLSMAAKKAIAIVVVESDGGQWNIEDARGKRDDNKYLKSVLDTIRDKSVNVPAAFDLDERAFYLVGYKEGGTAAQKFAMEWPVMVCGTAVLGAQPVPETIARNLGGQFSYPFAQADSLDGQNANRLPNNKIPVPQWIIQTGTENVDALVNYWVSVNQAVSGKANDYAQRVYDNGPKRIWVTESAKSASITPEILYEKFLSGVQRFVGDPGGRLEWTVQHTNDGKKGFFRTETKIDGSLRRWLTYVPSSYQKGTAVPLVVAMHGYTSAMTAFTGDSRWQDVAEKYGFIVLFPQAYPNHIPEGQLAEGNIDAPVWKNYGFPLSDEAPDDVAFIRSIVEISKKNYTIDNSRIFASGHSNGSSMTWSLALDCQDLFAACAPVGLVIGGFPDTAPAPKTIMPIWTFIGEFDLVDATRIADTNTNGITIQYWKARSRTVNAEERTQDPLAKFINHVYKNSAGVPLFIFSEVPNSPHAYMPYEAEMIWTQFFSKFSRQDGILYYEGKPVDNPYVQ